MKQLFFQDCQIKYRMQVKFEFQTNNFYIGMSQATFETYTDTKKVSVVYLKFKFSYLPCIFIC